jgi:hypothetical protein
MRPGSVARGASIWTEHLLLHSAGTHVGWATGRASIKYHRADGAGLKYGLHAKENRYLFQIKKALPSRQIAQRTCHFECFPQSVVGIVL